MDAIRRHVMSALETDRSWNEVVFMKTLKSVVQEGEIEQHTFVNCALSPEYKRRRADSLCAYIETKRADGAAAQVPYIPENEHRAVTGPVLVAPNNSSYHHLQQQHLHHPLESTKEAPKRKVEHDKYKIIPKPIYDQTTKM